MRLSDLGLVAIKGVNKHTGGSNGAGKTSLIESIVWCLYSRVLRPTDSVDDIVNHKLGYVIVTVKLNIQGRIIEISRYRKHKTYGTGTSVKIDGISCKEKGSDRCDSSHEDIIGLPLSVFLSAVLFSPNTAKFTTGNSDAGKKSIVAQLMGLDYNSSAYYTSKILNEIEHSITKISSEIDTDERNLAQLLHTIKTEIEESKQRQELLDKDLSVEEAKLSELQLLIDKLTSTRANEIESLRKLKYDTDVWTHCLNNEVIRNIRDITNSIDQVKHRMSGSCPVCKAPTSSNELVMLNADLNSLESKFTKLTEKRLNIEQSISQWKSEIDSIEQGSVRNDLAVAKTSFSEITRFLNARKHQVTDTKLLEKLVQQKRDLLASISQKRFRLEKYKSLVSYLNFWEIGFGKDGLLTEALRHLLPQINSRIDDYITILSGGTLTASLVLKGSKLTVHAKGDSSGGSYGRMSDGERRRIDLAIYFAFHDAFSFRHNGVNILFVDEAIDIVDDVGVDMYVKLLSVKLRTVSTIFVISHKHTLVDVIPTKLMVVKDNGSTLISMSDPDLPLMED
jgi:DNA repair exonuclease SbcCD ATPase subunit